VINAIRKWFKVRGMSDELLVTATTGAAAVKIGGCTLHSAIGLSNDGKCRKVGKKSMDLWFNRQYLIIDEVSMMDAKLLGNLHTQLGKIKSDTDSNFGGVNILFAGDFLQLPTVSHLDVYLSDHTDNKIRQANLHWHKLNAVVVLKKQMGQAKDQRYAELLSRVGHRFPTDEDLRLLYSKVGAPLPPSVVSPLAIVRRNKLRYPPLENRAGANRAGGCPGSEARRRRCEPQGPPGPHWTQVIWTRVIWTPMEPLWAAPD
jgi:hypothetical protein